MLLVLSDFYMNWIDVCLHCFMVQGHGAGVIRNLLNRLPRGSLASADLRAPPATSRCHCHRRRSTLLLLMPPGKGFEEAVRHRLFVRLPRAPLTSEDTRVPHATSRCKPRRQRRPLLPLPPGE
uniref:DEAD/DEAH box helicase, putative n=1 Tax=Arundo donax TaxID=35708 RepID=A0A0A9BGV5_ARUDO